MTEFQAWLLFVLLGGIFAALLAISERLGALLETVRHLIVQDVARDDLLRRILREIKKEAP